MFKIGYRTLKTAIGAAIAIAIAQWIGLTFYASAGIIAILCIQKTRRKSLLISWERFFACMIGLLYGAVLFELIGYNPFTIGLLLVLFIPTVVYFNAHEGIVTSSVIILHLYTLGQVNISIILNELGVIIIGIGVALLMNTYMPSVEGHLRKIQLKIENNYKTIFEQFSIYLQEGDNNWDGREITETADLLKRGKGIALENVENHLLRYDDQYYHYFKMREKQFDIIERMMPFITSFNEKIIQGKKISSFLLELSKAVTPNKSSVDFLDRLYELQDEFKQMELPKDREEFEIRSALFGLVKEIEQYLIIKRHFRHHD